MSSPEFGSVQHTLGRMDAKLDQIDGKIDGHGERIVALEVRSTQAEKDLHSVRTELTDGRAHQNNGRQLVIASLVSGGTGAVLSGIITWLSIHH